jgi:hypothetical protein
MNEEAIARTGLQSQRRKKRKRNIEIVEVSEPSNRCKMTTIRINGLEVHEYKLLY